VHLARDADAFARLLLGPAFGGVPAVGDGGRPLQRLLVEPLVGRNPELLGEGTVGFGDHAFARDDGVAFDAGMPVHAAPYWTPMAPMMAPWMTRTPSQWRPSSAVSMGLRWP